MAEAANCGGKGVLDSEARRTNHIKSPRIESDLSPESGYKEVRADFSEMWKN